MKLQAMLQCERGKPCGFFLFLLSLFPFSLSIFPLWAPGSVITSCPDTARMMLPKALTPTLHGGQAACSCPSDTNSFSSFYFFIFAHLYLAFPFLFKQTAHMCSDARRSPGLPLTSCLTHSTRPGAFGTSHRGFWHRDLLSPGSRLLSASPGRGGGSLDTSCPAGRAALPASGSSGTSAETQEPGRHAGTEVAGCRAWPWPLTLCLGLVFGDCQGRGSEPGKRWQGPRVTDGRQTSLGAELSPRSPSCVRPVPGAECQPLCCNQIPFVVRAWGYCWPVPWGWPWAVSPFMAFII